MNLPTEDQSSLKRYLKHAPEKLILQKIIYDYISITPSKQELLEAAANLEEALKGKKQINPLTITPDKSKIESFVSEVCYKRVVQHNTPNIDIQYMGANPTAGYDYKIGKQQIEVKSKHQRPNARIPPPSFDTGIPPYSRKTLERAGCTHLMMFSTYEKNNQLVCILVGGIAFDKFMDLIDNDKTTKRVFKKGDLMTGTTVPYRNGQLVVLIRELTPIPLKKKEN